MATASIRLVGKTNVDVPSAIKPADLMADPSRQGMYCFSGLQPLGDMGALSCFHPDQAMFGGIHEPRRAALVRCQPPHRGGSARPSRLERS